MNLNEAINTLNNAGYLVEFSKSAYIPVSERIAKFTELAKKYENDSSLGPDLEIIINLLNKMHDEHKYNRSVYGLHIIKSNMEQIISMLEECGIEATYHMSFAGSQLDVNIIGNDLEEEKTELIINELLAAEKEINVKLPWLNKFITCFKNGQSHWSAGSCAMFGFKEDEVKSPEFKAFAAACKKRGITITGDTLTRYGYTIEISWDI